MAFTRIIARLDIKGPNVIKGVQLEGSRVVGNPSELSMKYYREGIDEIIYMDTVASLYGRNGLHQLVSNAAKEIFIPLTVGGGIRSCDDVQALLNAGADKVAVNTAAVKRPELITEISRRFGSQCMVLSIEAKKRREGGWEALTDNGREHSGLDAVEWAKKGYELGAGEILLTSVDKDGTKKGFDLDLVQAVSSSVPVPVIASGGMGTFNDLSDVMIKAGADAVAIASVIHFGDLCLENIRMHAISSGLNIRPFDYEEARRANYEC